MGVVQHGVLSAGYQLWFPGLGTGGPSPLQRSVCWPRQTGPTLLLLPCGLTSLTGMSPLSSRDTWWLFPRGELPPATPRASARTIWQARFGGDWPPVQHTGGSRCRFPLCRYAHLCARCRHPHSLAKCRERVWQ